jgi:hypothetical protein
MVTPRGVETRGGGVVGGVRLSVAALSVIAALTLSAFLAQKAEADAVCPSGYACLWTDTYYNGDKKTIPASQAGNGWINLTGIFDNNVAAFKNHYTNKFLFLSPSYNGGSIWQSWQAGTECPDMDIASSPCNGFTRNTASSFMIR